MPEVIAVKTAGFVDRGSNYDRKRRRIEDEENEIAKLEAEARGEPVEEGEPEVADTVADAPLEEVTQEVETKEDDSNLSAEEKSFKKRYGDLRRHMQQKEKEWEEKLSAAPTKQSIAPPSQKKILRSGLGNTLT